MTDPDLHTEPAGSDAPRVRGLGRRVATWLGIIVAVLVGVVLVAALLLRTEWGRGKVQEIAVGQIQNLLAEGNTVTVDRLDGGFLTGARLLGLDIAQRGRTVVHLDTVRVDYNLLSLLRKRLSLGEVTATGLSVYARQAADSSWNVANLLKPAVEDTSASAFVITLDRALLRRGHIEARFYSPEGDSVLSVDGLAAALSSFEKGPDRLAGSLDTLYATATPSGDAGPMRLATAGAFGDDRVTLSSFLFTSDDSDVRASGTVDYGGENLTFDADLQATPLAFADVRAFAPVSLYGSPTVRLQASGTPEDILARLNAEFDGGGTVALSGAFSGGGADGPVRYVADGTVRDLDPGRILGNPALAGTLSADLDLDLRGPARDALDGTLDLKVRPTTLGDRTIERADLVGQFTDGRLQFTLGAAVPGARLLAEGTARPFDDAPRYNVEGQLQDVDLAVLLQNPEQQGRFAGTFAVEGRGTDPETAVATATVRLDQAQFGETRIEAARLTARLRDGAVGYDAEVTFPDGGLAAADGVLRPFAEPLAYRVDQGRLENFDLAAVTGDTTHTDLTGRFALAGSGTEPTRLALDLSASLEDSRYADYTLRAADLAANLRAGLLTFDLGADLGAAGGLDAEGTARPFDDPIRYDVRGNVRHFDLGALTADTTQSSDLSGAFAVAGTGTDPQTLAADVRFDLRASRFRHQRITDGTLVGTLRGGALDLNVDATTPDGDLRLVAQGRPFDSTPTLRLSQSTFRGLNLAGFTGNPSLQTDLNGRIELDAAGFDPQLGDIEGRIVLTSSRINDAVIEEGTLRLDVNRGFVEAGADLDFAQGAATASFAGRPFDETPSYRAAGALDSLDVAALLGQEALPDSLFAEREATHVTLAFDVEGRGFDPETMTLDGSLRGSDSEIAGATVDSLRADFALAGGVVRVPDLLLRSSFADATAEGQIALPSVAEARTDFTFDAEIKDTAPLNAFLAQPLTLQQGSLEGRATGAPGGPLLVDVRAEAEQFAYGETRASTVNLALNGEYVGATAPAEADTSAFGLGVRGTARVEFGFLSLPSLNIEGGDIDLTYDGRNLAAQGAVGLDRRRDLEFRIRTDLNPDDRQITLETFTFNVDGEPWQLLQEATIGYGERFRFRNLLLYSGDEQIAIDGVVDLDGEQNLVLTVEQVGIDALTDLVGYDGVGGVLSTTLVLAGPASAPTIQGTLRLDSLVSGGETVGSLDAEIAYDASRLTLDVLLTHVSGRTLSAEGFLPLNFRLDGEVGEAGGDVDFVVRADSFPVSWAEPFLPPETFTEVGGALDADITVSGTQADPQLGGTARLSDGRLGLIVLGRTIRNVEIPLVFDRNIVRVQDASAGAGDNGRLTADGTITLPKLSVGELAIALEMDHFNVIDTRTYQELRLSTRDMPLLFQGTTEFPRLSGALTLESGDIYLTEELTGPELEEVELSAAEIQEVEATFGVRVTEADTARSVFVQNLALDLDIVIDRNVWLRSRKNPVFDIEFAGTLLVEKEPGGENQVFRSIEVTRGRVEYYGRRFDIERGVLTFNGPVPETRVDIEAAYDVPARQGTGTEATILLAFEGILADGPTLTLSADPAMENTDILSYIATGQPAGEAFQGGGGGSLGNIALGQAASVIEGLAANSLGLDVVDINVRPDGSIVATFGTYVTNRVFASFSPVVTKAQGDDPTAGESRFEATLEYQLLKWLALRLERRLQGGDGGSAQVEFSY